jgi:flagellin
MSVINTNIKSLISQNAMVKNNRDLGTAMQQLSTGKRINSAKDDAAGLAITSRMTSQIRGLDQAIRNGNDAISMLQTTEGAMVEMTNMLQRMRELAIQSANDTYTQDDRGYLNQEFQQLKTEINRITRDTQWNGMDVLNGTFINDAGVEGKFRFQLGSNAGQVITHTIGPMGFKESTGDAVFDTGELTLAGDYSVGDKISLPFTKDDGTKTLVEYSVTGNDLISGDRKMSLEAIAKNMATKVGAEFGQTLAPTVQMDKDAADADIAILTFDVEATPDDVTVGYVNNEGLLTNIKDLDITTSSKSNEAISAMDTAINNINQERAGIGAVINRVTYATDNLTNVSQNTSESRSRILDTDYAKASAELARTQIISQAATAMLAQANQQPQTVLKLLQG